MTKRSAEPAKAVWTPKALHSEPTRRLEAKSADGIHGSESAEGHSVLFFGDNLGGQGVFERLFRSDIKTSQDKNHSEQSQRMCTGTKQNRRDSARA